MQKHIKLFSSPEAADGYVIDSIPFLTTAADTNQNLYCAVEGKKIKVVNGVMTIDNAGPSIEMVDLGLSVLWAKTNLGAQIETDYGNYYQWAATTPLHIEGTTVDPPADWSLCPYTDDGETFEKYNGSDYDTLQTSDDVATVILGAGYRMPTQDDFQELIFGTNNEWIENYNGSGVNGYKFTNKSDSSRYIFLPAAGFCDDSNLGSVDGEGNYWSPDLNTDTPNSAYYLYFNDEGVYTTHDNRYYGFSVRPVL